MRVRRENVNLQKEVLVIAKQSVRTNERDLNNKMQIYFFFNFISYNTK